MKTRSEKNKKYILVLTFISFFFASSCTKNFESINDDPNNPEDVPNSYFLAGAERGIMDNTVDIWWGGQVGNQLAQYWSSNQYTNESRYLFRTTVTNDQWADFYSGGRNDALVNVGGLLELKHIVDNCTNDRDKSSKYGDPDNQIAVATILRVWLLQNMTDCWGDIPYTETLDPEKTRTPKYDRQADIYPGLIAEINSALTLIKTAEPPPDGDLVYGLFPDPMGQWVKFANSLKMRLAIRIADANPGLAASAFNEALAAGVFTSNADNALLPYEPGTSFNPIYYDYSINGRNDYAASNILLNIMVSDAAMGHPVEDPRLPTYYEPSEDNGSWVGEVYGLSDANAAATPNGSVSQRSPLVLADNNPGIFIDYAQIKFMMAEAIERGWATGNAQTEYNDGITASIEYWTTLNGAPATQTEIDAYILQDSVDYVKQKAIASFATDQWKFPVGKQKWIALYNQGIQGWTEWRRLDFGILQPPADGSLEGPGIPNRMKYAVDEQTLNSGNYAAAVSAQGPDLQATKVWWDKN